MQPEAPYINHGEYLDTQVDDSQGYDYIDIDAVVPEDSYQQYQELFHTPQTPRVASPDTGSTRHPPAPVRPVRSDSGERWDTKV